jgi:proteic killer suppression protein
MREGGLQAMSGMQQSNADGGSATLPDYQTTTLCFRTGYGRGNAVDIHLELLLHSVTLRYTVSRVIKQFRHKGLQRLFETGSKAGVQAAHVPKLRRQLARLDAAGSPQDMNVPGWKMHSLTGDLSGHWSVWVSGNWRLTFTFDGEDTVLVDYRDYH